MKRLCKCGELIDDSQCAWWAESGSFSSKIIQCPQCKKITILESGEEWNTNYLFKELDNEKYSFHAIDWIDKAYSTCDYNNTTYPVECALINRNHYKLQII